MMNGLRVTAIAAVLLALGAGSGAMAVETEVFERRIEEAVRQPDAGAALRTLDALAAEALQAGRIDLRVLATAAHARLRIRTGDFNRVREDLVDARSEARTGGWLAAEAWVNATFADYWQAQGDVLAAAEWLEAAWSASMAAVPAESDLAVSVLARLGDLREAVGQDHLAAQARAWLALLTGSSSAPPPEIVLQPVAMSVHVSTEEVGRARLFLANATPVTISGTLLVDAGDLSVRQWVGAGTEERVTLRFPSATGAVPHSNAQGRRVVLHPGESRTIVLEVEPNAPSQPGVRRVTVTWQTGETSVTSIAEFLFDRARDLPGTSVANACHVRLSPLFSVPVYMEIYHRGSPKRHIQDLLPVTSEPCRIELYEILAGGARGRHWLAVDADGDGGYFGPSDAVGADANDSGFPDVEFSHLKEVAALELRLYPLAAPDGSFPARLDLNVALRDGARWRQPADVSHRIDLPSADTSAARE